MLDRSERSSRSIGPAWRIIKRIAAVLLTAMAFGFGGGLGGLGSGTQKVGKPERDNPIVCVAEHLDERD
ncbi:MAG TPA: hypothetical protein VJV79_24260 [Polyangiaceae bacterium]|nr:hypothetical protein [Polyangiaceae bacterium]